MYDYYAYSDDCEYYAAYTYDANGNIASIEEFAEPLSYGYDSQNQLIRENDPYEGTTVTWEYDSAGNILSRKEYSYTLGTLGNPISTTTYTYADSQWGDLLTGYDGKTITYDNIGNMLTYGSKRFTWEHGRELASLYDGTATWNYTYDADGMRTGRRSGSTAYTYVYNGSQLTQMTVGSNILRFSYEPDGKPFTVTFNGVVYYYMTNPQGDVVKIMDSSGSCVVSYSYDAWGNPLPCDNPAANTVGALNPLRYRGYVYDTETGLYYLQSRYYDPEIGRFINADAYVATGQGFVGNNMFAYCLNNPINHTDPSGEIALIDDLIFWGAIAVVTLAVVVILTPPPAVQKTIVNGLNQLVNSIKQTASVLTAKTKGKENVRDTGLSHESDAEVQRKAHDKSLPKSEQRRYQTEEKARGLRNRRKRLG